MKVTNLLSNDTYEVLNKNGHIYIIFDTGNPYVLEECYDKIDQIDYHYLYSYYQDKESGQLYDGFFTNEAYLEHKVAEQLRLDL